MKVLVQMVLMVVNHDVQRVVFDGPTMSLAIHYRADILFPAVLIITAIHNLSFLLHHKYQ